MEKDNFIHHFEILIKKMVNKEIITSHGTFYSEGTIMSYETKLGIFFKYERYLGQTISLKDINLQWCEDFGLWLVKQNYAKNSIAEIMGKLKAFLRRANKQGLCAFNGSGVITSQEITTAVYSTMTDIKVLANMSFSNEGEERIRDVYVCQCFIGLRRADAIKLLCDLKRYVIEVDNKRFLKIKTSKTGEEVVIPLSPIIESIMERRGYDFGKPFTQQYYSKTLKHIVAKSSIDREIMFNRTEGGIMRERVMMYSELICTHTARRTFATNAYLAGINPLDIMKITGHRSFCSFNRYIRCDNLAVALRLSEHEFFTKSI